MNTAEKKSRDHKKREGFKTDHVPKRYKKAAYQLLFGHSKARKKKQNGASGDSDTN